MSKTKMVDIDGSKLRAEFERRSLSLNDVSEEFGYYRQYLTTCVHDNKISAPALACLVKYDISLNDVKPDVKSKQTEVVSTPQSAIHLDYERLGKVIYDAVLNAVKDAWN